MTYRYSSRYPSAPPDPKPPHIFSTFGHYVPLPDHYILEPSPPPQKKKPKPRDYAHERQSKVVERDPCPYFPHPETLTHEILDGPSFRVTDAAFRIFFYEVQERCRMAYKPPPPHFRAFSKMLPTYADDDWKLRRKRGRPRKI